MIRTAPRRYKTHLIEKRNGRGLRQIAQPTAELKLIQRWIVGNHLNALPVHRAAMAYRPGLGIKDHASPHAAKKYLLKLDFADFFQSIKAQDFEQHLVRHTDMSESDTVAITKLLFKFDKK